MGVPALFRWLSKKYPKIIEQVIEEKQTEVMGTKLPVDISKPNPNNVEFDNLYLDMNGIIHPCCHPDNKPAPETEEDMMVEVIEYTERIIAMIRPRKVLYLAIDGVAPRAKMNQQRSRRFRTAQEAKEKAEKAAQEMERLEETGSIDQELKSKKSFDSNCITPGTPFMARIAACLRYWIADKLNSDPGWKNLKVILSDACVPGEGEHKIMDFIRAQRASPYHDPNTRHVIYGLDADLIMLSLATHEPHFKVLREDVFFQEGIYRGCFICGQSDHMANQCTGRAKQKQGQHDEKQKATSIKPYVFLNVQILREYLEIELKVSNITWPFNLENAIDDWVFLCFFVGNDFLPHLPSLEIREGAIDTLITIWKRCLPLMGGYLTNSGVVDLKRLQYLVTDLGKQEDDIFIRRHRNEQRRTTQPPPPVKRQKINKTIDVQSLEESSKNEINNLQNKPIYSLPHLPIGMPLLPVKGDSQLRAETNREVVTNRQDLRMANINAAQSLKAELNSDITVNKNLDSSLQIDSNISGVSSIKQDTTTSDKVVLASKRKADELDDESATIEDVDIKDDDIKEEEDDDASKDKDNNDNVIDSVRLWEAGFKERYYKQKFGVELPDKEFQKNLIKSYIEGLSWVLQYYYQGVPSWQWYYPYHYSPFASDFIDIGDIQVKFELGEPFKPFEQLMSVLPAQSKEHLPEPFQRLMTDENSDIIDFYPKEFQIDLNGKKYAWQGVALLPFIDESRLRKTLEPIYSQLSVDEITRNTNGSEILCFSNSHKLYNVLCSLYSNQSSDKPVPLDPTISDKMIGFVSKDSKFTPKSTFHSPLIEKNMPDIISDRSLSVFYYLPTKTASNAHKSILLRNVRMDPPVLGWEDHESVRNGGRGRGRGRGRGSSRDDRRDDRNYHSTYYQNRPAPDNYGRFNTYNDNRELNQNYHYDSGNYYNNRDAPRYQHYSSSYQDSSHYGAKPFDNRYGQTRYSDNYSYRGNSTQARYNDNYRVNPVRNTSASPPHGRFDRQHQDKYRRDNQ